MRLLVRQPVELVADHHPIHHPVGRSIFIDITAVL